MNARTDKEWEKKLLEVKNSDFLKKNDDFEKAFEIVNSILKDKGSSAREFSDLKKSLRKGTATKEEEKKYFELKTYLTDNISKREKQK